MAKKRAKLASQRSPLPNPGDAFLMPLEDGRFGVCRVVRLPTGAEAKRHGEPLVLAAASSWIGTKPPKLTDPRLREILVLTHHSYDNRPAIDWVFDPPPASFQRLGSIAPSPAEARLECYSSGAWVAFPLQVYLQWRWDHERAAVLLEEQREAEEANRQRARAALRRRREPAGPSLEALRKQRRFSEGKGAVSDQSLAACRRAFRETIDALIQLGPDATRRSVLRTLRQCIEHLNELDEQHEHFIGTIEREDLCAALEEIVDACGLTKAKDLADRWRTW